MAEQAKRAVVTGASKGVGRGIALGLAEAGWDVVINYHSDEAGAKETAAALEKLGRQAWICKADVGRSNDVDALFAFVDSEVGPIQLLVNNSGIQTWASILDLKPEDWERTIRTNLTGCFLCTQAAARRMKDHGGGSIINLGSGANRVPFPNLVDYSASKGGIEMVTKVGAVELGKFNIRVNCVAPGAIEIERTKIESPDYANVWGGITPLGRVGYPTDVAAAVVFLAAPEARFITGQTLWVDGGLWTQGVWPYKAE